MYEQIEYIKKQFEAQLVQVSDEKALEDVRVAFMGRSGHITGLLRQLKELTADEKRTFGPLIQELQRTSESKLTECSQELLKRAQKAEYDRQAFFDVTAYKPHQLRGSLHPLTRITQIVEDVCISMGCTIVEGPELETPYYNFQALNIPDDHPAREEHDTFWLTLPDKLLRTHTSPVQIHTLEHMQPPLAIVAPGRVFRHEATDASHDYVFMQVEGLWIDKNISVGNLLATATLLLRAIFERDDLIIRSRPGFFPFVEPGIEIDMQCPFCSDGCSVCKKSRWVEIMGSGLVHPNVLQCTGINPDHYNGFAFGFGLTRLAMLKYGINDIRLLHSTKLEFLKQF